MKLKISGTCFLLPKNNNWSNLIKNYELNFSDPGKWDMSFLNSDKFNFLIQVINFTDLINSLENQKKNFAILKHFFILLNKRLRKSKNSTIILYTMYDINNLLKVSKKISENFEYKFFFLKELNKLNKRYNNLYTIDLDQEFFREGAYKFFDKRNFYFANCHFSNQGIHKISECIGRIINRIKKPSAKLLILDCDNTIWGGVAAEDGIKNIRLGQDGEGKIFLDFQKAVKKINNEGILISICSKNNEKDVWEVFNKHDSMILKKKDLINPKINWKKKSQNILNISKELDLSLDSIVFWDDNPFEREEVKKNLKDVNVVDVPDQTYLWPEMILNIDSLSKINITKEDLRKNTQYEIRSKFIEEKNKVNDDQSYLKSISLKPKKIDVNNSNISRAEQMCQKTNQFNLRTVRYSLQDIQKLKKDKNFIIFLVSLKDIYGDHGIISLISLKIIENKIIFIENFLMSCRVLGRNLDSWILNEIVKISKKRNINFIVGEYIKSNKNELVKKIYLQNNFKLIKKNNDFKKYIGKSNIKNLYFFDVDKNKIPNLDIYE